MQTIIAPAAVLIATLAMPVFVQAKPTTQDVYKQMSMNHRNAAVQTNVAAAER